MQIFSFNITFQKLGEYGNFEAVSLKIMRKQGLRGRKRR